jgi:serralysin
MMPYTTIDYLPDLTPAEMASARLLTLSRTVDPSLSQWENSVIFASVENNAILRDTFLFQGTAGASYSILSSSYFDPYLLEIFDSAGNVIAVDDGLLAYGFDHVFFFAPYSGTYYINASWNQGSSSLNKAVAIGVFEDLDTVPKPHVITGTNGDDRLLGTWESDVVSGGAGLDTFVLGRQRAHYSLVVNDGTITTADLDGLSGTDTLQGIERVQFFDVTVSIETTGVAPQAYRLYQAAFARAPDAGGLGFWIKHMEAGLSINSAAAGFMASPEFIEMYGANPTDQTFITKLYSNVLHRAPEQSGMDFWMRAIAVDHVSRAEVLGFFSESPENQAQVIGSLTHGYEFTY